MRSFYHSEICWLRRLRQKLVSSHSQSGQKLRLLPVCCQYRPFGRLVRLFGRQKTDRVRCRAAIPKPLAEHKYYDRSAPGPGDQFVKKVLDNPIAWGVNGHAIAGETQSPAI